MEMHTILSISSFTDKTRHLGDSETIILGIPRLQSVKRAWFYAQQRGTEQTGLCCAFRPPRGSKCSSHSVSYGLVTVNPTEPTCIYLSRALCYARGEVRNTVNCNSISTSENCGLFKIIESFRLKLVSYLTVRLCIFN